MLSIYYILVEQSGNYMLSSSKDSTLKVWDIREGRLLFTMQGHTGPVNAAKFSTDGNFFASGGADQLVMVWKSNLLGIIPEDWDDLGGTSAASARPSSAAVRNSGR
jgi:WD40 repeat protein